MLPGGEETILSCLVVFTNYRYACSQVSRHALMCKVRGAPICNHLPTPSWRVEQKARA